MPSTSDVKQLPGKQRKSPSFKRVFLGLSILVAGLLAWYFQNRGQRTEGLSSFFLTREGTKVEVIYLKQGQDPQTVIPANITGKLSCIESDS